MLYILIACSMLSVGIIVGFTLKWLLEERPKVLHYYGIVSEEGDSYVATFPDFGDLQVKAGSIMALKSASLEALEKRLSKIRYSLKVPTPSDPKALTLGEEDLGRLLTVVYQNGMPSPDLGESIWNSNGLGKNILPSKANRQALVEDLLGCKRGTIRWSRHEDPSRTAIWSKHEDLCKHEDLSKAEDPERDWVDESYSIPA